MIAPACYGLYCFRNRTAKACLYFLIFFKQQLRCPILQNTNTHSCLTGKLVDWFQVSMLHSRRFLWSTTACAQDITNVPVGMNNADVFARTTYQYVTLKLSRYVIFADCVEFPSI